MIKTIKELINRCTNTLSCKAIDFTDLEVVKLSTAVMMWSIVIADNEITRKEISTLYSFFQNEFDMNDNEIDELLKQLNLASHDIELHAQNIAEALGDNHTGKLMFIKHLTALMNCDQTKDIECRVFEKILSKFL